MQLHLNAEEYDTLAWIADRYDSGSVLWACAEEDENGGAWLDVTAHADRYLTALATENGNPAQRIPPCAGGTLAEKLHELYDVLTGAQR